MSNFHEPPTSGSGQPSEGMSKAEHLRKGTPPRHSGDQVRSEAVSPIRIAVVQLGAASDVLRSLMALRAAKQLYPRLEIDLITREVTSEYAKHSPWINHTHALPVDSLTREADRQLKATGRSAEPGALRPFIAPVAAWISPLIDRPWELLFNWTYSDASAWLAGILPAAAKFGYIRRKDATAANPDGWSQFIQAIVQQGSPQNIHLVDILTTQMLTALQLHVGDPEQEASPREILGRGFFELPRNALDSLGEEGKAWKDPSRKWVTFTFDSERPAARWPAEQWADLAVRILSRHADCNLVLLGTGAQSREAAETVLARLQEDGLEDRSVLSLIDQPGFALRAAIVTRSQWVICSDSDISSLASVLGTRVIELALGGMRHRETGPYGNGHFVLEPAVTCAGCEGFGTTGLHACQEAIAADLVYAAWHYGASEWAHRREIAFEDHLLQLGLSGSDRSARVCRSRVRLSEEGGGVEYELLQKSRKMRFSDWSARVTGHVARAWYCGWTPSIETETPRQAIGTDLVRDLRKISESVEVLSKISEEGRRTSQLIQREASRARTSKVMSVEDRRKVQELALKLSELDQLLERLIHATPCLSPFLAIQRVMMHNLIGDELAELGRQSAATWDHLVQGTRVWKEWIDITLRAARPKAIPAENLNNRPDGFQA